MALKETIQDRHLSINKQLIKEFSRITKSGSKHKIANKVAAKFDLSWVTIVNYGTGKGSDGYTKEAILEELKKL